MEDALTDLHDKYKKFPLLAYLMTTLAYATRNGHISWLKAGTWKTVFVEAKDESVMPWAVIGQMLVYCFEAELILPKEMVSLSSIGKPIHKFNTDVIPKFSRDLIQLQGVMAAHTERLVSFKQKLLAFFFTVCLAVVQVVLRALEPSLESYFLH